MPRRSGRLVWAGRVVFAVIVAGLIAYLVAAGLDKADKVASSISVVLALAALAAPYLLPPAAPADPFTGPPLAGPSPDVPVNASGAGAVALGTDNEGEVSTEVSGVPNSAAPAPSGPGVTASGTGSVAVGGSNTKSITTKVTGPGSGSPTS